MNKTISINIAGFVFNIEEGAYEILSRYLESIKNNFKNEADCDEIMADIEARIAELFQEKLGDRKEVIIDVDVEEVISVMGKPEDYMAEEIADNFTAKEEETTSTEEEAEFVEAEEVKRGPYGGPGGRKRLYRDEDNGHIGGVCMGLGWFFGLDPTLVRLAFVLLTILGGSGILIYIILWIVIPQAKTTAEILEMQGEAVTLDSIKDHVQGMKSSIKDGGKEAGSKVKSAVDKGILAGSRLAENLSKVIGAIFILCGIAALMVLFIVLFGNTGLLPIVGTDQVEDLTTFLSILYPDGRSILVFIAIMFVVLIPVIGGIVLGVKMLFGIKTKFKRLSIVSGTAWFLAIGILVLTGIELGMNFRNEAEIDYDVPVVVDSTDVLYIDVQEDDIFNNFIEYQEVWNYSELVKVNNERIWLGYPELRIVEKGDSGTFNVMMYKKSHARYNREAISKAENISYEVNSSQNKLMLAPYFSIDQGDKMRGQKVVVEVYVPTGKTVKFGDNIDRILVGVSDEYYRHNETFANTSWAVTDQGFRCTACQERRVYHPDYDEDDFD